MANCCWQNPRIPLAFIVIPSGVGFKFVCPTCANFNGAMIVCEASYGNCENYYPATLDGSACGTTQASISPPSSDGFVFTVPGTAGATYAASGVVDYLAKKIPMSRTSEGAFCSWPMTLDAIPVAPIECP